MSVALSQSDTAEFESAVRRLVSEILWDFGPGLNASQGAHDVLLAASEDFIAQLYSELRLLAANAGRVMVLPRDLRYLMALRRRQ